ncbi:MAG: murein hydrolase activator EnvC family protein [Paracoccaceae bacterium]
MASPTTTAQINGPGAAQTLRAQLDEIATLKTLRRDTVAQLQSGLSEAQTARLALSQAVAARTDLPKRFAADPVRLALLANAAQSLDDFARTLATQSADTAAQDSIEARRGRLILPVRGTILRKPGEPDAADVRRPGLVMATEPRALVVAPVSATLRFRGAMPGHNMVAILEPQPDLLIVLTGMGQLFGSVGDVVPQGAPVGLMGGQVPDPSSQSGDISGTLRSETLYIEVRQSGAPVDPLTWFTTDKD